MSTYTRRQSGGTIEPEGSLKAIPDEEEPGVVLFMTGGPDFVMAPEELGGDRVDIIGRTEINGCPMCHDEGPHPVYVLDRVYEGGRLGVIGCSACGQYVWVTNPKAV